jgi:hypothetical protein
VDRQFSLELSDALLGRGELVPLGGRQARDLSAIDLFLSSPDVDGLRADAQIPGQVGDPASGCEQIEHAPTELRWIPSPSHGCLLYATAT